MCVLAASCVKTSNQLIFWKFLCVFVLDFSSLARIHPADGCVWRSLWQSNRLMCESGGFAVRRRWCESNRDCTAHQDFVHVVVAWFLFHPSIRTIRIVFSVVGRLCILRASRWEVARGRVCNSFWTQEQTSMHRRPKSDFSVIPVMILMLLPMCACFPFQWYNIIL